MFIKTLENAKMRKMASPVKVCTHRDITKRFISRGFHNMALFDVWSIAKHDMGCYH
jgi:hypothetical protein